MAHQQLMSPGVGVNLETHRRSGRGRYSPPSISCSTLCGERCLVQPMLGFQNVAQIEGEPYNEILRVRL